VDKMMQSWLSQSGYPFIFIKIISWDSNGLKIQISQDSFPKQSQKIWPIPITFTSSANPMEPSDFKRYFFL